MVIAKIFGAVKYTAETVKGAAVVLASPNAEIPASKLHPRMPARPWTAQEWYLPVFRFYIYSGIIVYGVYKFVLPIKPRHMVMYRKGKDDAHHHEVEHWYGIRQKNQDKEYFKKYDPLRTAESVDVGGH
uniref:Uncharacterized protein n=1 Tax=Steinernema glaseri TaxID=37863 RepID=A0A1I7Z8I5_9BILA